MPDLNIGSCTVLLVPRDGSRATARRAACALVQDVVSYAELVNPPPGIGKK